MERINVIVESVNTLLDVVKHEQEVTKVLVEESGMNDIRLLQLIETLDRMVDKIIELDKKVILLEANRVIPNG